LTDYYDSESIKRLLSPKKWISPHKMVTVAVDERAGVAEIIEDHARGNCLGGSAWSLYHYTKNSESVFWSKREGPRLFYKVKLSKAHTPAYLVASYDPASIESVVTEGDKVKVTYSGLAGAGVAALSRGMAEGVEGVEVMDYGGGKKVGRATLVLPKKEKLIIGVDDTDKTDEGATWSLVNELANEISSWFPGTCYLENAIVQLYPQNPHKTQNCVAVSTSFAVLPDHVMPIVKAFKDALAEHSLSKETGMAFFRGIQIPVSLMEFAKRAKSQMVTVQEAEEAAKEGGVTTIRVTGDRGLIGAVASIAYVESPDEAVRITDSAREGGAEASDV
jgi:methanogenesis imperfect marker protein 11